ncbi:MAG: class I SAM-dependent methyltransferase [Candidatus Bathyarchaeia archaeon]
MDFHSHIRYRAVKKVLSPSFRNVEIGAGSGVMSYHFILNFKRPILVLTYTIDEYNEALSIIKEVDWLKNYVILGRRDAQNLKSLPNNYFDQVLLIDVLEHVKNDDKAVKEIYRILKSKGRVIVSVPTPYYPHYFTPEFDQKIGHLRHYTPNRIRSLFEMNGFKTVSVVPHTSSLSGALSHIWYGKLKNTSALKMIIMPIIITLSLLTEKIHSPYYCGLIAVFEKFYI